MLHIAIVNTNSDITTWHCRTKFVSQNWCGGPILSWHWLLTVSMQATV